MRRNHQASRWAVALFIGALALATSDVAVRLHIGVGAAIPGFMLLALFASWRAGFVPAVVVSMVSTVCLDYFFTEPKYSLTVSSYQDLLALSSFAGVSVIVSLLVRRIKSDSLSLAAKEMEQRELFQLSQNILLADWKSSPEEHLCSAVQSQLGLRGISLWDERTKRYWRSGDARDDEDSLLASLRAGLNYDSPSREEHIRILRFGARSTGIVFFRGTQATPLFLDAVAALIASYLERLRALRAEVMAESVAASEQLRTAVLDGLAHSVKTPLTTIAISASGLTEMGDLNELQKQFAHTIEEQALSISELTTRLLRTARLDTLEVTLRKREVPLANIYESAIAEFPSQRVQHRIQLSLRSDPVTISCDPDVVRMALIQLLENGLKYSPADSPVLLSTTCSGDEVEIAVHNEGTFIPPEERTLIFERYYRSPSTEHKAPGTGLGLSIVKRGMDMHQGSLRVESSPEGGTTFFLSIPKGETC